jgi:hypothetical protein
MYGMICRCLLCVTSAVHAASQVHIVTRPVLIIQHK